MALAAQALEAKKADKPLEQGGVLEQVAARIKRVMGLTAKVSGGEAVRLTAKLDPKAKRERPALKKGAAKEKALGHGSGAELKEG